MYIYTYIHTYIYTYIYIYNLIPCGQVHELPQSHCGDNEEGILFS